MRGAMLAGVLAACGAWGAAGVGMEGLRDPLRRLAASGMRAVASMRAANARRASRRQEGASVFEVCEMVDAVRLGLLAGLSFDAALALYCEHREGALARAAAAARMRWQMGVCTREEGLMRMADEVGVRQLEAFASAVGQAHELGAPLAETLARQARELRCAHRASVERAIERAPVKMLVPTGMLILPALLLSIVGPLLASGGMV